MKVNLLNLSIQVQRLPLSELWKERYVRKRITNLVNNDRTNLNETLFYDELCYLTWDECKEKYLSEVGR